MFGASHLGLNVFIHEGLDFRDDQVPLFLDSVGKWVTVEERVLETHHVRFHVGYVRFVK